MYFLCVFQSCREAPFVIVRAKKRAVKQESKMGAENLGMGEDYGNRSVYGERLSQT